MLIEQSVPALSTLRAWACNDRQTTMAWLAPRQAGGLVHRLSLIDPATVQARNLDGILQSAAEQRLDFIFGCVGVRPVEQLHASPGWRRIPYGKLIGAVPTLDGRRVVIYIEHPDHLEAQVWACDGWRFEGRSIVPPRINPGLWAAVIGRRVLAAGSLFPSEAGRPHSAVSVGSGMRLIHADELDEKLLATGGADAVYASPLKDSAGAQQVMFELNAASGAAPPPLPLASATGDAPAMVVQTFGMPWPHRLWSDAQGAWLLTLRDGRLTAIATAGGRSITLASSGATAVYQNIDIAADGRSALVWQAGTPSPLRLLAIDQTALAAAQASPATGTCAALREVLALPQEGLRTAVLADDGRSAVLIHADRTISMLDLPAGTVRWSRHDVDAGSAGIQPQGFVVALWAADSDRTISLLDAQTGDVLRSTWMALVGGVIQRQPPMVFTPDGCNLLISVYGGLSVLPVFRPGYADAPPRLAPGPRRADGPLAKEYRRIACQVLDQGPQTGQLVYDRVRIDGK